MLSVVRHPSPATTSPGHTTPHLQLYLNLSIFTFYTTAFRCKLQYTYAAMITATRRWFRRNRTKFAVGAGTLGLAYLAGQYAWSKWLEARQRMSEERIAKEK